MGLISDALKTEEGKKALAKAMVDPIKISLQYQGIGRKLIMSSDIAKVERVIEPILDIEDWIDESYWPEWRAIRYNGEEIIVKAPNETQAEHFANKISLKI